MKIERISDNQIRCTLNKQDLIERELKISELAYGSDKAKELFRDMMEQANIDFGFDADDIPLMIEAIPTSRDSIVLVITKVDNPEEFDEKFSRFGIHGNEIEDFDYDEDGEEEFDFSDIEIELPPDFPKNEPPEVLECLDTLHKLVEADRKKAKGESGEFIPLSETLKKENKKNTKGKKKKNENSTEKMRAFSFFSLNDAIHVAHMVPSSYTGKNTMWKDENSQRYYLTLNRGNNKAAFRTTCSIVSEFAKEETVTYATQDFYNEHYLIIIKDRALTQLALL